VYTTHLIVTIIRDAILLNEIAQSDDVGDGSCDDPNVIGVARHSVFVSHYHSTTAAFQYHDCGGFASLAYQGCIIEMINSLLTAQ
jgi:hypothetical protein